MKTLRLKIIAVAMGCTLATGAMAADMTASEYETSKAKITEERRAADEKCEEGSEGSREDCLARSRAKEMVRMAQLEADYRPGAETEQALVVAGIEADYLVAIAKCGEGSETSKLDCVEEADSAKATALADAGADVDAGSQFSATGSSADDQSVAGTSGSDSYSSSDSDDVYSSSDSSESYPISEDSPDSASDDIYSSSESGASSEGSEGSESYPISENPPNSESDDIYSSDDSNESYASTEGIDADSEAYFDFGEAELGQSGRDTLDEFVENLERDNETSSILIVGYTDRIGPDEVNQQLSRQRAENVKAYLVSQGIDADRIRTEGRGSTGESMTAATDCTGKRGDELINCLQPDRKVQLQVTDRNVSQR